MSRLDELKRNGFTKSISYVEVEDVDVLQWNKELLVKDSELSVLISHNYLFLVPFGLWLKKVEKADIAALTNKDITILFDKYCLYYIASLTEPVSKRTKKAYIDVISYCDREFKRLTSSMPAKATGKIVPLCDVSDYLKVLDMKQEEADAYMESVIHARELAEAFRKKV